MCICGSVAILSFHVASGFLFNNKDFNSYLLYWNMDVNMIVAAGDDGAIGRKGDLIWHISSDLRRFKALTMGHPVIMGRKTWESLPKKPLPGRLNIVMTRNAGYVAEGAAVAASPEEALRLACEWVSPSGNPTAPFVMGGAQIYNEFMPLVNRIFLTRVHALCHDADALLPKVWEGDEWEIEDATQPQLTPDGVEYDYVTYRKR